MKPPLLGCALLLVLAGCAAHAPRCDRRLTPINPPWKAPDSLADPPQAPKPSPQAAHS